MDLLSGLPRCHEVAMEKLSYGLEGCLPRKEKVPIIVLEAIVDHRLWFWHLLFGMPGAKNDLNILDCSLLFKQHMDRTAPKSVCYSE